MCRIAGILSSKTESAETYRQVKAMCTYLQHGGPDDEGIYLSPDGSVCLGHRRLSILDLSAAGHQPMRAESRSLESNNLWISYNGEIYNFKEIRNELVAKGVVFHTESDTEVILLAYREWGVQSFGKLKGMFSFALTDHSKNKTYLVRDPSGIKPLYYGIQEDTLIFSSEVRAFDQTRYRFHEDENWKIYLLAFGHIPEPHTTLRGVKSLPKGNYLCWDHQTRTKEIKKFYQFDYSETIVDTQEAIAKVREMLQQAVKRHLISDAPIGVFLSGGIDSSIVSLIANQYQNGNLNTLSINLEETDYTEKKYQDMVIRNIKGQHNEYFINYKEFIKNFSTIIKHMDQPSADGINSWFVSKYAKENGLKAVLSGLGGDELFGGYPSFQRMPALAMIKKMPSAMIRLAELSSDPKIKRLYYLSYNNPVGEYLFLRGFYIPPVIASVLDADLKEVDELIRNFELGQQINSLSGGNRASWFETNMYMQNQLLKDTDYMSMSHGIEVRVPFLDQDLVALALSIHPDVKFNPKQQKTLLIQAFKDILPEPVWNRRKMGFSFPFDEWMKRFDRISDPELYKNKTAKKLMNDFHKGKLHWSAAFALYHINGLTPALSKGEGGVA